LIKPAGVNRLLDGSVSASGVARANLLQAKTSQGADADAPASVRSPLTKISSPSGKMPTPDIPILEQAKAEYAKLQ